MNELDIYYRALLGYRKLTSESDKCTALRSVIAGSSVDSDKIIVKTATCTIDEDWVEAIEAGLVHVEKAIKMERQFIRSNGEVIPIEKVKHVSKESVEHLARHSSLISRYDEGEDIVPDKLYTVERLNDYAVYENRFLYMLLCYLRDFVTIRYNEILDLTNKYDATISFDKKVKNGKQSMSYTLSMHDVRRDDDYLKAHNPSKDVIDRIDLILKTVLAFLATPLMEEVGKVPMIKPPITKTNVLKMNNSFKGAMALYEFIVSYDKKGYDINVRERSLAPFRDELADELAEAGGMIAFLAYEWGLGIKQELKDAYAREEERRAAKKIEERAERIESMQRRLKNGGVSIEEYVLTLEKQLRALEGESKKVKMLTDEIDKFKEIERGFVEKIESMNEELMLLNRSISEERQRYFEEIEALNMAHEEAMHSVVAKYEVAVADMDTRMRNHEQECRTRIKETRDAATAEISEMSKSLSKLRGEYDTLLEDKRLLAARFKAVAGVDYDHTDKESFNELEKEFEAFTRLYKQQWNKTKRQIRKTHLTLQNIKGQTEYEDDSD